jgi:hypothetical protein
MSDEPGSVPGPDIAEFCAWWNRTIDYLMTARGWGVLKVYRESGLGKGTCIRWQHVEKMGPDGPQRDKVEIACRSLKVPMDEPFTIMRWQLPDDQVAARPSQLAARVSAIDDVLETDELLTPEERTDLEATKANIEVQIEAALQRYRERRKERGA